MTAIGEGLLPDFCDDRPLSATGDSRSRELSPAATVCTEIDETGDIAPEFKLRQCFGDCSPAEEVTPGNVTRHYAQGSMLYTLAYVARFGGDCVFGVELFISVCTPTFFHVDFVRLSLRRGSLQRIFCLLCSSITQGNI